jgi:hypothetical protein
LQASIPNKILGKKASHATTFGIKNNESLRDYFEKVCAAISNQIKYLTIRSMDIPTMI